MNNRLLKGIDDAVTELTLREASDFPPTGVVKIEDEYIAYNFSGFNNLLECVRGYAGSTPVAHDPDTLIELADISDLSDKEVDVKSYLTLTGEELAIVLDDPLIAPDQPQVLVVSHRDNSEGTLSVNTIEIEVGASSIFIWDGFSWSSTSSGSGPTFPLLADDGTVAAPSYSFTNDPSVGFLLDGAQVLTLAINNKRIIQTTETDVSFGIGTPVDLYITGSINLTDDKPLVMNNESTASFYYDSMNASFVIDDGGAGAQLGSPSAVNLLILTSDATYAGDFASISLKGTQKRIEFDTPDGSAMHLDESATATHTRMLIYDVDSGSLQRVMATANDAVLGVTGRVLYIANI